MVIEVPFELDTIEAIQEARGTKELTIAIVSRIAPFFIYVFCTALEYFAYDLVASRLDVVCIARYEISEPANLYLMLSYLPIIPDGVFAILGPISILMIYNNPYGVIYNALVGLLCIVNGILFHTQMTFCGDPAQTMMAIGPILLYISGILHITNAVIHHISFMNLDKVGEVYFGRLWDLIDDYKTR